MGLRDFFQDAAENTSDALNEAGNTAEEAVAAVTDVVTDAAPEVSAHDGSVDLSVGGLGVTAGIDLGSGQIGPRAGVFHVDEDGDREEFGGGVHGRAGMGQAGVDLGAYRATEGSDGSTTMHEEGFTLNADTSPNQAGIDAGTFYQGGSDGQVDRSEGGLTLNIDSRSSDNDGGMGGVGRLGIDAGLFGESGVDGTETQRSELGVDVGLDMASGAHGDGSATVAQVGLGIHFDSSDADGASRTGVGAGFGGIAQGDGADLEDLTVGMSFGGSGFGDLNSADGTRSDGRTQAGIGLHMFGGDSGGIGAGMGSSTISEDAQGNFVEDMGASGQIGVGWVSDGDAVAGYAGVTGSIRSDGSAEAGGDETDSRDGFGIGFGADLDSDTVAVGGVAHNSGEGPGFGQDDSAQPDRPGSNIFVEGVGGTAGGDSVEVGVTEIVANPFHDDGQQQYNTSDDTDVNTDTSGITVDVPDESDFSRAIEEADSDAQAMGSIFDNLDDG